MSLIDNVHKALENDFANKSIIFESDIEDEEAFAFEVALNPDKEEDSFDSIDLTDEELEQLEKEIEDDLKIIDDTQEEDPDLNEDEDVISIESMIDALALDEDEDTDDDLDDGIDAVSGMLDEEIDALIDAGIDADDLDGLSE